MKEFIYFILVDGLLLVGLFYSVTFVVTLIREQISSQELNVKLLKLPLGIGNLYAAIFGAITPFCSCSTVPIFSGMIKSNIRFGISITFLIASPLVSEAVVIMMIGLFGLKYTIGFISLSITLPILIGIIFDKLNLDKFLRRDQIRNTLIPGYIETREVKKIPLKAKLKFASLISRNELREIFPYLLIGLFIGGAIYSFVPREFVISIGRDISPPVMVLIMTLIGAPLYINMTSALPIAFALFEKGIGIGPITAFLIAGAGTSVPEMILLLKLFRVRLLISYVIAVILSAISIGLFFTYVF